MKTLLFLLLISLPATAAEWQWSVPVAGAVSSETPAAPQAFLWIPEKAVRVHGIVVGMHNMQEEGILEHPRFREALAELGLAEVWITPGLDPLFDPKTRAYEQLSAALSALAEVSGYSEIATVPLVPLGHSAYASYPWNFGAWHPERTLAMLSIHGDAPMTHLTGCGRPNLDWKDRDIAGIPGLMVMGEYEWWEERLTPALRYRALHEEAAVSFLADAGRGHFDHSEALISYLALFLKKAVAQRCNPDGSLRKIQVRQGHLKERWYPQAPSVEAAPYSEYKGNKEEAFWYFDAEMAEETERYYARERAKIPRKIRLAVNGKPVGDDFKVHLGQTGDTVVVKAFFEEGGAAVAVERICGPVEKWNDTTFVVAFYRMGLENKKRTNDIWLVAQQDADSVHKSAVQQLNLKFTYPIRTGQVQNIQFPRISNVRRGTQYLHLRAKTDSGLSVRYYVKEGPAKFESGRLYLTEIPPRSRFPIRVTVVAWQYGDAVYRTAEAVERSFFIYP